MNEPPKPYQLRIEDRERYLYAYVKAESMTGETALDYFGKIAAEAARLRRRRVLLERDIPVMLSAGPLFFATQEFIGLFKGKRVVFVNPYPELDPDMELSVTIATNRGAEHNVVRDIDTAEKWLLRQ